MVNIRAPLIASFAVTAKCNLKCKYCYYTDKKNQHIQAPILIDLVKSFHDMGVFQIMLGGGEPFMHPEIFDILEELLGTGIKIAVLSNGLLFDDSLTDRVATIADAYPHTFFLQVSLDSHIPEINDRTRGHGREVMAAIERLVERGVDVQIACVITRQNVDVADQLIDHFFPRVRRFHYMGLMPSPITVRNLHDLKVDDEAVLACWQRLAERKQQLPKDVILSFPCGVSIDTDDHEALKAEGCLAGITRIDIDADLDVVACQIAHHARLGNLKEQSFEDIWQSEEAERIRAIPVPLCWMNLDKSPRA